MNDETLLLRQIHPGFLRDGAVTSQAFRPTPKDDDRLSCDDNDKISAEAAWCRHTAQNLRSSGVQGVTSGECKAQMLRVDPDATPHPEHVSILFGGLSHSQREKISKRLREHAATRDWLFQPKESAG